MNIPVDLKSIDKQRSILAGKGTLSFTAQGGPTKPTEPFSPDIQNLVSTKTTASAKLEFGEQTGLFCEVGFSANSNNGIDLFWPSTGLQNDFLEVHDLKRPEEGRLGARLYFDASAKGNVKGSFIAGPGTFTFGVAAGAGIGYERYREYDANLPSGEIVMDLLGGVRLPQHCNEPSRIPAPGELLVFRYDGFLEMNAGLNWGYQLSGSHGFDYHELSPVLEYDVRAKASVDIGYSLAGEFSIETRRGSKPDHVRVTVRKRRDSTVSFAAALDVLAKTELTGAPKSADEFLLAAFGADAKHALGVLDEIQNLSDLEEVKKRAGKLLEGVLDDLCQKWLRAALDEVPIDDFLSLVRKAVDGYKQLDQVEQKLADRVMQLYEDLVGQDNKDEIEAALRKISNLDSRDGLRSLTDNHAWAIIQDLLGADMVRALHENEVFAQLDLIATRAVAFLDGSWQSELKDLVDSLRKQFKLDTIFGQLEDISTKQKLVDLTDRKLQGFAEKMLNVAFEEIKNSDAGKLAKELNQAVKQAKQFKDTWYRRLVEAADRSFKIQASYAYSRASTREALIDVEINLRAEGSKKLFEAAASGNFRALFTKDNLRSLIVHQGVLTHSLTKTNHLQIHAFGWDFMRMVEVFSHTENALKTGPSGQVMVFTTEAHIKQVEQHGDEGFQSSFLMRFLGEASLPDGAQSEELPYLVKQIDYMGVEYNLVQSDGHTDADELAQYLKLAENLDLIPSRAAFSKELAAQFPDGLGAVKASYVVTFDHDAVRNAFLPEPEEMAQLAETITRQIVAARLVRKGLMREDKSIAAAIFTTGKAQELYKKTGSQMEIENENWTAKTPPAAGGKTVALDQHFNFILTAMVMMEVRIKEKLEALDRVIDLALQEGTKIPESELEDAAREFVECASRLDRTVHLNGFFAVFDALVARGSRGKGYRESTMILQIHTEDSGKTVTKYLSSGKSGSSQAQSQQPPPPPQVAGAGGGD